ncbi:MAG: hypothetical protein Q3972_02945 [Corynebacterium sp.]|nr:hypothetical protein [Corynebacterium sp.]
MNPQNMALWLGAWLYGFESHDALEESLYHLGSPLDLDTLREIRQAVSPRMEEIEPAVRLILGGPGQPPALPPGDIADYAMEHGVVVLNAQSLEDGGRTHYALIEGKLHDIGEFLPAPAHISPGQADQQLSQATYAAASLIDASPEPTPTSPAQPRLRVGYLTDHYDLPGMPLGVPDRAGKLLARANRVEAIIEASGYQKGDIHLMPLWRHIREARMCAVEYALSEWAKERRDASL